MIDEPIEDWIDYDLDDTKERKLFEYLESRKYGTQDITIIFLSLNLKLTIFLTI